MPGRYPLDEKELLQEGKVLAGGNPAEPQLGTKRRKVDRLAGVNGRQADLPTWRAPMMKTTGVSASASRTRRAM